MQLRYCPKCGTKLDGASAMAPDPMAEPEEGDVTVCIRCGVVLQFGAGLSLELVDPASLPPQVREIVARIQIARLLTYPMQRAKRN